MSISSAASGADVDIDLSGITMQRDELMEQLGKELSPDFAAFVEALPESFSALQLLSDIEDSAGFKAKTVMMGQAEKTELYLDIIAQVKEEIFTNIAKNIPSLKASEGRIFTLMETIVKQEFDKRLANEPPIYLEGIPVYLPRLKARIVHLNRDKWASAAAELEHSRTTEAEEEIVLVQAARLRNIESERIIIQILKDIYESLEHPTTDMKSLMEKFSEMIQECAPEKSDWLTDVFFDHLIPYVRHATVSTLKKPTKRFDPVREKMLIVWDTRIRVALTIWRNQHHDKTEPTQASSYTTPPSSSDLPQS